MDFKERTLTGIKSLIAELKQMIVNGVTPARTISWFYRDTAPTGWDICDGRIVTMNDGTSLETPNLIGRYPLGATSGIGSEVSAGLPNITGTTANIAYINEGKNSGALRRNGGGNRGGIWTNSTGIYIGSISIDASNSSAIYGNSDTVTPPSVRLLPCIKL